MPQAKLLQRLADMNEPTTAQTIRNREKQGVAPGPLQMISGQPGRSAFYTEDAIWENYAAGRFLRGGDYRLTSQQLSIIREVAKNLREKYERREASRKPLQNDGRDSAFLFAQAYANSREPIKPNAEVFEAMFALLWLGLCIFARLGRPVPVVFEFQNFKFRAGIKDNLNSDEVVKSKYFSINWENDTYNIVKADEMEFGITDLESGQWINLNDIIPKEIEDLLALDHK